MGRAFDVYRILWIVLVAILCLWFVNFAARAGAMFNAWNYACTASDNWKTCDPMSASGYAAVLIGLAVATLTDRSQIRTVHDWRTRGLLDYPGGGDAEIFRRLFRMNIVAHVVVTGAITASVMLGYVFFLPEAFGMPEFLLSSIVSALAVGARMGRGVAHGLMGRTLRACGATVNVIPGHSDKSGGLARIGDFYLAQAGASLVPALWLMAWILLIPSNDWYSSNYSYLRMQYWYLFLLAIVVFSLVFILPMSWFRDELIRFRRTIAVPIAEALQAELSAKRRAGDRTFFDDESQDLLKRIDALLDLPTLPISPNTKKVFATSLFLPVFSAVLKWSFPFFVQLFNSIF